MCASSCHFACKLVSSLLSFPGLLQGYGWDSRSYGNKGFPLAVYRPSENFTEIYVLLHIANVFFSIMVIISILISVIQEADMIARHLFTPLECEV